MTYRRRYRATLQVAPVVDLLVADEGNPRSIVFQLAALAEHVAALPRDAGLRARRSPEERIAFEALSAFRLVDVEAVCARRGRDGARRCARCCGRPGRASCRRCRTRCPAATSTPATDLARARLAGDRSLTP